jgi:hypothetical protein
MKSVYYLLTCWQSVCIFCHHQVVGTVRFCNVAKFTTLTPLLLLISCKLVLPIVGLKMSSLPTLALRTPNKNFHMVFR